MAFLDATGLQTLWNKTKATFGADLKLSGTVISLMDKSDTPTILGQVELPTASTAVAGVMSAADKSKLDGIDANANKTVTDTAMSSTSTNPVQNKVVNTAIGKKADIESPTFTGTPKAPTAAAGTDTTQVATTAFVTTAVKNGLDSITGIDFKVVDALPETGAVGTIYLLKHAHSDTGDSYDEYVYITGTGWEKIGNTDVDLSGYWSKSELAAMTSDEIAKILV